MTLTIEIIRVLIGSFCTDVIKSIRFTCSQVIESLPANNEIGANEVNEIIDSFKY